MTPRASDPADYAVETIAIALSIVVLATAYTAARPEVTGAPFIEEFDALFNAGVLALILIGTVGAMGLASFVLNQLGGSGR